MFRIEIFFIDEERCTFSFCKMTKFCRFSWQIDKFQPLTGEKSNRTFDESYFGFDPLVVRAPTPKTNVFVL